MQVYFLLFLTEPEELRCCSFGWGATEHIGNDFTELRITRVVGAVGTLPRSPPWPVHLSPVSVNVQVMGKSGAQRVFLLM